MSNILTTHDVMRLAVQCHGLTNMELTHELQTHAHVPSADAEMMVGRLLDGGPCAAVLALAIFELIAEKQRATRH